MTKKQIIGWIITIILTLFCWCVPTDFFGIEGLTVMQQRIIAIFVFSACMWISEAIPIWATSVVIMVLMLLTTSDSMLEFMKGSDPAVFGETISYKSIMHEFANPTVMLFMGGFVLAIAAAKYKLDANLARVVIGLFGKKPSMVMLGFIVITALLSMFMSNTATAAMMVAILTPVLASLPESDNKGKVGMALAIPIAANIGGLGTPIGTPPNVVAVGYLKDQLGIDVSFASWMLVMVPVVLIILFLSWIYLSTAFKSNQEAIEIKIEGSWDKSREAIIVYITFIVTVLLWVFGKDINGHKTLGINANVVALIPFAVFVITGVFKKADLAKIDWDVLWLVAGGFALGVGINDTKLAEVLVNTIPFNTWPAMLVILGSGVLCLVMSTFMSNSASAALLIPILIAVATGMKEQLAAFGGATTLIIGLAMSASLAMALPISTPPNAIAYSKGFIKQKDMAVTGILVGLVGLVIGYIVLIFAGKAGIFA
ncbi:MAG: SLC13 family permease [Bacteroidales bacterium]|nr:SLC13 family permease [Bacteroidales bacterium]